MDSPLSVGQIARMLEDSQKKISKDLNKMLRYKEIECVEIDRIEAYKKYNCKKRMRLYFVKGFLMASVDLVTGKIFGCEKGSKVWYHEQAHIKFNETEWGAKIAYYQIFFMMIAVFFTGLSLVIPNIFVKIFAFINSLGMLSCYLVEEIVCWLWALREYNKK